MKVLQNKKIKLWLVVKLESQQWTTCVMCSSRSSSERTRCEERKKINRDARNKPGMSSLFHLQASLRVQYNYQETSSIWLKKLVNIVHSVNSQCYLSLSFLVVYLFSSISLSCGIKYVCRNKMLQYSWMHAKREREKENSVLGCIKRFNFNTHSI